MRDSDCYTGRFDTRHSQCYRGAFGWHTAGHLTTLGPYPGKPGNREIVMDQQSGNIATAMANAPLVHEGKKGKPDKGETVIGAAMTKAMRKSSVRGAKKLSAEMRENSIAAMFGKPEFQLPESIREFPDRKYPDTKKNATVAKIILHFKGSDGKRSPLRATLNVYQNSTLVKTADGRKWREETAASMIKNLGVDPTDAAAKIMLDAFVNDLTEQYRDWRKTVNETVPIAKSGGKKGAYVTFSDAKDE